jgi:hypothetical protein
MYYWIFAILYTFFTIIISHLLIPDNIRLIYYFAMILLFISLNNIYFSISYYVKLRNIKGIKGDRGDPGEEGQDGSNGVCLMSKNCGIINCRDLIIKQLEKQYPEYKLINEDVNNNLELSVNKKKKKEVLEKYINILLPQCENFELDTSGSNGINAFIEIIEKTIKPDEN